MSDAPRAAAIVPVRLDSQRLPRKAMLAESGTPLFLHTWQRAAAATAFDRVIVATDSDEIEAAAKSAGADVVRTSPTCRTGSERCAEAAGELGESFGYFVNIQGDWPEVAPDDLDALVACLQNRTAPTATLAVELAERERIEDPNVVKVVRALDGRALYFSRATIPFVRGEQGVPHLRHIGVYAFDRATLLALPGLPSSGLAETESLEQLRLLENGIMMHVLDATGCPWGIESRPDYDAFLERLHHSNRS